MCTKCTNVAWHFCLHLDAAQLGQMEGGAYVYVVPPVLQRIAEEFVGRLPVVLGGEAAEIQKIISARFAAVGGYGKGQLYILLISGSDVGSCIPDCFSQEV